MHHVADGRRFDEKNLAEIAMSEIGRWQDQNYSPSEDIDARLDVSDRCSSPLRFDNAAKALRPARHHHLQQTFERGRGVMPKHGDLAIRRKPIELNDAALADERFMAVP